MRPQAVRKPAARKGKQVHPKYNLSRGLVQARIWTEGYQVGETAAVVRLFDVAEALGTQSAVFDHILRAHQRGLLV